MVGTRGLLALLALGILGTAQAGPLKGAIVVAADGTFLGTCDGEYGSTSIANDYSRYGGPYSSTSMFNEYGQYGSEYARYSAFNELTLTAPYLLSADPSLLKIFTNVSYRPTPAVIQAIQSSGANRVSANRNLLRAIDPNVLRVACENP